jgi:predicted PurR-regulated permease PerM
MLGIDRNAARYTWTAAAVLLLIELIYQVRSTLFIFALAVLFAYLLAPLVDLLDRALPNRTRTLALATVYAVFVVLVVLIGAQIGTRVVDEAHTLAGKFPDMLASWENQSAKPPDTLQGQILNQIRSAFTTRINELVGALPNAGIKFLTVASNVIYLVIVPVLAFFFLKDSALIRKQFLEFTEIGPTRVLASDLMDDVHKLLAHYMRALVVLSLSTFTAYSIFFTILGVPYGILLAVLAMLLEFIPMIGPLTASAVILIVAAISGGHVLGVLIFVLAFRMFQDYVLSPNVMGQGVELHPLLVMFGVFAGGELAGIAGSFLSVPLLALARILYLHMRRRRLAG